MRPFSLALLAAALAAVVPAGASAAVHRHPLPRRAGRARCGSISVPLDRSGAVRGRLKTSSVATASGRRVLQRMRRAPAAGEAQAGADCAVGDPPGRGPADRD